MSQGALDCQSILLPIRLLQLSAQRLALPAGDLDTPNGWRSRSVPDRAQRVGGCSPRVGLC
jgi:hypothetical protein